MSLSGLRSAIGSSRVHERRNAVSKDSCIEIFLRIGFDTIYPSELLTWSCLPVFHSTDAAEGVTHQSKDRNQ